MLLLPRWETSAGAKREKDYAFLRGMPTYYDIEALVAAIGR